MIIVIDAYNLLQALPPYGRKVTEKERTKFISQVGKYGRKKGHKMVVVFDGGPYEWTHKERVSGVYVVYSGVHETADDYIKGYLGSQQMHDILLVSSDNELNEFADHLDIPSIGSFHFYQLMQEALSSEEVSQEKKEGKVVKLKQKEKTELDTIMEEGSKVVPLKSEDVIEQIKNDMKRKTKPGKKEKKLMKKLKKL